MIGFWRCWENSLEKSMVVACLLISGSQVRALVRPPKQSLSEQHRLSSQLFKRFFSGKRPTNARRCERSHRANGGRVLPPTAMTSAALSNDGLEREFKFFNCLKGGACMACAPGDQEKSCYS